MDEAWDAYHAGEYHKARRLLEEELENTEKSDDAKRLAALLNNLADGYVMQGRLEEAAALFERALEIQQKNSGPDSKDAAMVMSGLALVYGKLGRADEAERLAERANAIHDSHLKIPGK